MVIGRSSQIARQPQYIDNPAKIANKKVAGKG